VERPTELTLSVSMQMILPNCLMTVSLLALSTKVIAATFPILRVALKAEFPKWESLKSNPEKVARFSSPKNDRQRPSISPATHTGELRYTSSGCTVFIAPAARIETGTSMTRAAFIVVIALVPFSMSAKQDSLSVPRSLVQLHELGLDLSPHGITANSCISIQSDGHFHLELRLQQLPNDFATLHIYEASLNDFQLRRLRSLLDTQNIKDLGTYTPPVLPMGLSAFASFDAHITREDRIQSVGYFTWDQRLGDPGQSPRSTPHTVKEQWRTSEIALLPLVQWFHEIEAHKWPEVPRSSSNLCNLNVE
jgi:hypothetical protein